VVVTLSIIVIFLVLISICVIRRKHHTDKWKLENSKKYIAIIIIVHCQ
jgi:preprotein translocase subunit SecY